MDTWTHGHSPGFLKPRRMILEGKQPPFALDLALPYCGRANIPSHGHPQRMTHAPTPSSGLDDPTSRTDTEFVHDERDIGQVDDLGSVWQGEGPEGRGWAEEVNEACMWCWGGHLQRSCSRLWSAFIGVTRYNRQAEMMEDSLGYRTSSRSCRRARTFPISNGEIDPASR